MIWETRLGALLVDADQAAADRQSEGNILKVVIGISKKWGSATAPPPTTPSSRFRTIVGLANGNMIDGQFRPAIGFSNAGWVTERHEFELPITVTRADVREVVIFVDDQPHVFKHG